MNVSVQPGSRSGVVCAPASKSAAHRLLICAALSREPSVVVCDTLSKDILATIGCLNAAGAGIDVGDGGRLSVRPVEPASGRRDFPCCSLPKARSTTACWGWTPYSIWKAGFPSGPSVPLIGN